MYNNRYSQLYPENSLSLQKLESNSKFLPLCSADSGDSDASYATLVNQVVDKVGKERITKTAEVVADAVNDPAVPTAVKMLWLSNYIESIAAWAVMDKPEQAVVFIKNCLNYDRKLEVRVSFPPV